MLDLLFYKLENVIMKRAYRILQRDTPDQVILAF